MAANARVTEPLAEPEDFVTVPGVTRARSCAELSVRPVVTPEAVTAETEAEWPTSVRSTSVKPTEMVALTPEASVGSLTLVWAIAETTGASLTPVIVTVT